MTFKEFRKWRRARDIIQAQVADSVGCTASAISKYEKGKLIIGKELEERLSALVNGDEK